MTVNRLKVSSFVQSDRPVVQIMRVSGLLARLWRPVVFKICPKVKFLDVIHFEHGDNLWSKRQNLDHWPWFLCCNLVSPPNSVGPEFSTAQTNLIALME